MTEKGMNPKVDFYFDKAEKWQDEIVKLRAIILGCGLTEELKWGCPCYTFQQNNIVLIHVFKEYCAVLFFKGALLNNAEGILIQQTENVQAARQVRFTDFAEIVKLEPMLKKTAEFPMAEEFRAKLDGVPGLQTAFNALTPGRQRGYLLHFSQPKQTKTREARVEKWIPQILNGKGLDDE
jgi:uncharacterized protein YdeI (YjbR/CyaY-like superfamily)